MRGYPYNETFNWFASGAFTMEQAQAFVDEQNQYKGGNWVVLTHKQATVRKRVDRLKAIRTKFHRDVKDRAKGCCEVCHMKETLVVHRIASELPYGGPVKENGIAVCSECLFLAEGGAGRFCRTALYNRIGSTFEQALKACQELFNERHENPPTKAE